MLSVLSACSTNTNTTKDKQNEAEETCAGITPDSVGHEEIPTPKNDEVIAQQAEHALYAIYFQQDILDSKDKTYCYSDEMKTRFNQLNISAPADKSYTKSFEQLQVLYILVTDIGYGYDIKWCTQDPVEDFNLVVTDVEVKDNDHVDINTKFHNSKDFERTYRMVRENGNFYIDDIDDLRDEAVGITKSDGFSFCKGKGKKTLLKGKMGDSPIAIALTEMGTREMPEGGIATYYIGDCTFPDGKKAEIIGYEHQGKLNIEVFDCKNHPRYYAVFDMKAENNDDDFTGKLSVYYPCKEFNVTLNRE